jgi:hypothetical protein
MSCRSPLDGFLKPGGGWTSNPRIGYSDRPMQIACGRCISCRISYSREWALRCVHEAKLHERNCFITLTYNDENLPAGGTLVLRHFQLFMKRIRKEFGNGIRFFHCGEYGEKSFRPHYHAILFNFDFDDKKLWSVKNGIHLYRSDILERLWAFGFATVGAVTFESAAYVARYSLKKIHGANKEAHYQNVNLSTGEVIDRLPEYVTMSRRPGIGSGFFDKFKSDIYPHDFIIHRGEKHAVPRYYLKKLEKVDNDEFNAVQLTRYRANIANRPDNTPDRRDVKAVIQDSKLNILRRDLE